jgi:hypothetical protein
MAASIKSFEVSDLLAVLPASTDDSRQALRFKFLKELYVSLAKVGGTSTGDVIVDEEMVACWGSPSAKRPFDQPFNGEPIPACYQVKPLPVTLGDVAKVVKPGRPQSLEVSKWGQGVNAEMHALGMDELLIPRTLACTDNVVVPSGTDPRTLSPKDLARAIWVEWQALGKMGNKVRVIHATWHAAYLRSKASPPAPIAS